MEDTTLTQDRALIESLGGPTKVANRLGFAVQRVHNWLKRGIPSHVRVDHPDLFMPGLTRSKRTKAKAV